MHYILDESLWFANIQVPCDPSFSQFTPDAGKFFAFFGFVTFGFMTFTFLGQMFMSLVRDAQTAQGIGGLAVVCTVLFSGILLRPDQVSRGGCPQRDWLLLGEVSPILSLNLGPSPSTDSELLDLVSQAQRLWCIRSFYRSD